MKKIINVYGNILNVIDDLIDQNKEPDIIELNKDDYIIIKNSKDNHILEKLFGLPVKLVQAKTRVIPKLNYKEYFIKLVEEKAEKYINDCEKELKEKINCKLNKTEKESIKNIYKSGF